MHERTGVVPNHGSDISILVDGRIADRLPLGEETQMIPKVLKKVLAQVRGRIADSWLEDAPSHAIRFFVGLGTIAAFLVVWLIVGRLLALLFRASGNDLWPATFFFPLLLVLVVAIVALIWILGASILGEDI
jgi:hypothetical protein